MSADVLVSRFFDCLPGAAPELPSESDLGLASAFDVDALCLAAARAAVGTGFALGPDDGAPPPIDAAVLRATLATQVAVDGAAIPAWADLSGYYRTADDRWIQFHANFPHHAAGIVARLGCEPDRAALEAAVATWHSDELEAALIGDGMVAAKLRTLDEWDAHPHAEATARLPLVDAALLDNTVLLDDTVGAGAAAPPVQGAANLGRPLRVLDTTRVLAGPVATQFLAGLGSDVLRVGAGHLPTVEVAMLASGAGKRNVDLDLRNDDDRARFAELAASADIWIDAYRPGALAEFGFDEEWIAAHRRGRVTVQVSAFDWVGPWAGRRGFDSIVQSTTGIVEAGRAASGLDGPTPLPVQALDYATGYFAAATAAHLFRHRSPDGAWLARLSLLRTRNALVSLGGPAAFVPQRPGPEPAATVDLDGEWPPGRPARLTVPEPLLGRWTSAPTRRFGGADQAVWLDRR